MHKLHNKHEQTTSMARRGDGLRDGNNSTSSCTDTVHEMQTTLENKTRIVHTPSMQQQQCCQATLKTSLNNNVQWKQRKLVLQCTLLWPLTLQLPFCLPYASRQQQTVRPPNLRAAIIKLGAKKNSLNQKQQKKRQTGWLPWHKWPKILNDRMFSQIIWSTSSKQIKRYTPSWANVTMSEQTSWITDCTGQTVPRNCRHHVQPL